MFINDKRPKEQKKLLNELQEGDFFMYNDELYIVQRISNICSIYNLNKEYRTEFYADKKVQPVEVNIEIIKNK